MAFYDEGFANADSLISNVDSQQDVASSILALLCDKCLLIDAIMPRSPYSFNIPVISAFETNTTAIFGYTSHSLSSIKTPSLIVKHSDNPSLYVPHVAVFNYK